MGGSRLGRRLGSRSKMRGAREMSPHSGRATGPWSKVVAPLGGMPRLSAAKARGPTKSAPPPKYESHMGPRGMPATPPVRSGIETPRRDNNHTS
eukprot:9479259-Pyramimonas_sp.AAC.1